MGSPRVGRRQFLRSSLAGAAVAAANLLAACSGEVRSLAPSGSPTAGPVVGGATPAATNAPAVAGATRLRIMIWGQPDSVNWTYQAFSRVYPEDAKHLTVEPIIGGSNGPEVVQKLRLMLAASGTDLPDIVNMNRFSVPEFAEAHALADLTDWMTPFAGEMIDSAKALATYNGRFVAVPNALKAKVWMYRQDLFDKAGLDPDTVMTIDDFVAAGKQLHAKLPKTYIYNLGNTLPNTLQSFLLSSFAPLSYFDRATGKFQVTVHPAFRTMFAVVDKLRDAAVAMPLTDFDPGWPPAFASDGIASVLTAEWMATFLPQYVPEQQGRWRTHAWPAVGPSNKGSDAGGAVWVIPKQAKNAQAAFEYLSKVALMKDGAIANTEIQGIIPYLKRARETVLSMPKPTAAPSSANRLPWPPEFFGADYFKVLFAAQDRLAWIDYDPSAVKEIAITGDWGQHFLAGQVNTDQALAGLQRDLESQIRDPWQV